MTTAYDDLRGLRGYFSKSLHVCTHARTRRSTYFPHRSGLEITRITSLTPQPGTTTHPISMPTLATSTYQLAHVAARSRPVGPRRVRGGGLANHRLVAPVAPWAKRARLPEWQSHGPVHRYLEKIGARRGRWEQRQTITLFPS